MREEQPFAFTCSTFEVEVGKTLLRVTFMVSFNASKQYTHPSKKKDEEATIGGCDTPFFFSICFFFNFFLFLFSSRALHLFLYAICQLAYAVKLYCFLVPPRLLSSSFFFPPSLVCLNQTKRRAAEDSCTRSPSQYTNIKSSLTICFLSFLFFLLLLLFCRFVLCGRGFEAICSSLKKNGLFERSLLPPPRYKSKQTKKSALLERRCPTTTLTLSSTRSWT